MNIDEILRLSCVVPLLTVNNLSRAQAIASNLVAGGLRVLEVSLRSEVGLQAIREMTVITDAVVGAGAVISVRELDAAMEAGAKFIVSPGFTESMIRAAAERGIAYLPGTAGAGEIMRGLELGVSHFRLFPAESAGGLVGFQALAGQFPEALFCPSDITLEKAPHWLAVPSVLCVGSSWVVPNEEAQPHLLQFAARRACALRHAKVRCSIFYQGTK